MDYKKCLQILEDNLETIKKDVHAPKALVQLYNLDGSYDKALDFLSKHHFRTWEGGREIYWNYVDANVLKALKLNNSKEYLIALKHLDLAMQYPENLEVGKPTHDEKNALIHYFKGEVYTKMNKIKKARECYQKSVDSKNSRRMHDLIYFQAESLKKLGEHEKAQNLLENLIEIAQSLREEGSQNTLVAVEETSATNNKINSYAYYLEALGNKGLGNTNKAKKLFDLSIQLYKNNLWANVMKDI